MKATKEQAAEWFEKMHPPGPAAREMYRMAAEALREPDDGNEWHVAGEMETLKGANYERDTGRNHQVV